MTNTVFWARLYKDIVMKCKKLLRNRIHPSNKSSKS